MLRRAKDWAESNGLEWRPELDERDESWLASHLLTKTNKHVMRYAQARVLMYTTSVAKYRFDTQKLRKLLVRCSKTPADITRKDLSKNARRKWKRYGIVPKGYRGGSK
jgi:hypothetical protein